MSSINWAQEVPRAYTIVENAYGIPEGLLFSIALTESGKTQNGQKVAWPWTLNIEGKGEYYPSKKAMQMALTNYVQNTHMIDVGPMQINVRWHRHRVGHPIEMTGLWSNLKLGAQILLEAYQRRGDWPSAVGEYHSRTPERAERYSKRVMKIWGDIREQKVSA